MSTGRQQRGGYYEYDWSKDPKNVEAAKARAAERVAKAAEEANALKRRELDIRERELSKE